MRFVSMPRRLTTASSCGVICLRKMPFVDLRSLTFSRSGTTWFLMNPPFGDPTPAVQVFEDNCPNLDLPDDLYCWFVGRAKGLLHTNGLIGCITSSSFKTYTQYEAFRTSFIATPALHVILRFGVGNMDEAYVEAACYVLSPLLTIPGYRHLSSMSVNYATSPQLC